MGKAKMWIPKIDHTGDAKRVMILVIVVFTTSLASVP